MKRIISILLCLVLILSSFTFSFGVDWSTTDQQNLSYTASRLYTIQQLLSSGGSLYSLINTISNNVNTIKGYLIDSNTSVAGWLHNINSWLSPIYTAITQSQVSALNDIRQMLGWLTTSQDGTTTTIHSYLQLGLGDLNTSTGTYTSYLRSLYYRLGENTYSNANWNLDNNGDDVYNETSSYNFVNSIIDGFNDIRYLTARSSANQSAYYATTQNVVNWANLGTSTFTPLSATDGLYKYLNSIQAPIARLSYVLASDERIEAQEAAAANEQAVVDNFIDSSGDGAASTSDFDSIAGFSSGYKSTFASDASPTGIFDIFNSNNMGWFSQETANQLDTTSNNRTKSDNTFNTPLLDQQINSIYEQLGVKQP